MSVSLEQIAKWLESQSVKYKHDTEKEVIVFGAGNDETTQAHYIRAKEDGTMFEWQMQLLDENTKNISIKNHEHAELALSHMLYVNYQTKFGTWEYDPSDGDIRLAVEIPLEDSVMTEKQFNRIFSYMVSNGQENSDEIRHILATGELKEDNSDAEMLATLEAMLEMLKSKTGDDSSSKEDEEGI